MFHGYHAILSGILGATASCFAKLAFHTQPIDSNPSSILSDIIISKMICSSISSTDYSIIKIYDIPISCSFIIFIVYRLICVLCMVVCNAYMIGTFLQGMDDMGSVSGTAYTTAFNFITSALYGYYIWDERYTYTWWIGFIFVSMGVMILSSNSSTTIQDHNKRLSMESKCRVKTE